MKSFLVCLLLKVRISQRSVVRNTEVEESGFCHSWRGVVTPIGKTRTLRDN